MIGRRFRHHAVPVPQQLPQIAVLPAGYPDPRKIILQQEFENVPSILAIRLLLPSSFGSDHLGIPPPQLQLQSFQQPLSRNGAPALKAKDFDRFDTPSREGLATKTKAE